MGPVIRKTHKWIWIGVGIGMGMFIGLVGGIELYKKVNESREPFQVAQSVDFHQKKVMDSTKEEIGNPEPGEIWKEPVTGMEFVWIPEGCFTKDNSEREGQGKTNESIRDVCVDGFWMGKFPVTQEEWTKVLKEDPSHFKEGGQYPVDSLSYSDVDRFLKELTLRNEEPYQFRLPTENEWEYACQAGARKPFYFKDFVDADLSTYAASWRKNTYGKTTPVGTFPPNAFGIYDMHGNIGELCTGYVLRGGSWFDEPQSIQCASRDKPWPLSEFEINRGVRLVRAIPSESKIAMARGQNSARVPEQKKDDPIKQTEPDPGTDQQPVRPLAMIDKKEAKPESSSVSKNIPPEEKPLQPIPPSLSPKPQPAEPVQEKKALTPVPVEVGEKQLKPSVPPEPQATTKLHEEKRPPEPQEKETPQSVTPQDQKQPETDRLSTPFAQKDVFEEETVTQSKPGESIVIEELQGQVLPENSPIKEPSEKPSKEEETPVSSTEQKHRFFVEAEQKTWIKVSIDGGKSVEALVLNPGEKREWKAENQMRVIVGNAGGIRGQWDRHSLKPLGKPGEVIRFNLPDPKYLE